MKKRKLLTGIIACFYMIFASLPWASLAYAQDKPTVTVTTSFLQDMVKEIAGDKVNIELVIPAGEDPHLFVPKAGDAKKIQQADLVLYHGLHFEGKMGDILESTGTAVSKDFPQDKIQQMDEDGQMVIDPHFWFNVELYKLACKTASQTLSENFPEHKDYFQEQADRYLGQLDELDQWIKDQVASLAEGQRYLVTPHDAFNYFAKAYGFEVIAPQGVSTDSEVSNEGIKNTAQLIVEHKIPAIFVESTTNPERMEKLKEAVKSEGFDVKVVSGEDQELLSDSLAPEGQDGDNYIAMYKHNIELIISHLSQQAQ